jgi:hypothetical protein
MRLPVQPADRRALSHGGLLVGINMISTGWPYVILAMVV